MEQDTHTAKLERRKRDAASLIAVAANLAILAGLIFVAVQVRQNTAALHASAYQTWLATNAQLNMAITSPDLSKVIAAGHADAKALDEETYVAYAMWILSFMQMAQATDYLYRQGMIDENVWRIEIQRAAAHLGFPAVKQWWDVGGKTQLAPEFVRLVDSTTVTIQGWDWDADVGFKTRRRERAGDSYARP